MKVTIKSWMGIFGLLGFTGLLYFKFSDPSALIFLSFFAFFGFFWEGKYADVKKDELYILNQNKAELFALRSFTSTVFIGLLVLPQQYASIVALISLSLAISLILNSFMFHRYETKRYKRSGLLNKSLST